MTEEERQALTAHYEKLSYKELADEFKRLQDEKDELKRKTATITAAFDLLTTEVIPEKLMEDGFKHVALADGGRIEIRPQAYCSTRAGQREALFNWLQEHEFDDLITEVVNPSTLKSFIKEQMDQGNPVPGDEIINYQPFLRATVVGRKN